MFLSELASEEWGQRRALFQDHEVGDGDHARGERELHDAVMRRLQEEAGIPLEGLEQFSLDGVSFSVYLSRLVNGSWSAPALMEARNSPALQAQVAIDANGDGLPDLAGAWSPVMAVLAALTMTVGNVVALWQQHAVRLLAWSSVAQAGYILVPFGAVAAASREEISAVLSRSTGYLAMYAVVNLCAFGVAAVVGTRYPAQRLADYRGLIREEPLAGWALAFALVALAGLPPGVIGLLAKVVVFSSAAGPATWLALVMAVNVAIGLVYYARWLMELFRPAEAEGGSAYDVPNGVGVAIGMTLTAAVVFSVLPGLLLDPVLADVLTP